MTYATDRYRYHAMTKTPRAIHPHTLAGGAVAELRINGQPHGETGLDAAVLGARGTTHPLRTALIIDEAEYCDQEYTAMCR